MPSNRSTRALKLLALAAHYEKETDNRALVQTAKSALNVIHGNARSTKFNRARGNSVFANLWRRFGWLASPRRSFWPGLAHVLFVRACVE
jgi:hypothetical protein